MKHTVNPSSSAVTRGISIEVESEYDPERSNPASGYYFFIYRVKISNKGDTATQLLSRHWIITDADGEVEEVRGPGVVGEQPKIEPGESFEYSSACPLKTPTGNMRGTYQMLRDDGEKFEAEIARFELAPGYTLH